MGLGLAQLMQAFCHWVRCPHQLTKDSPSGRGTKALSGTEVQSTIFLQYRVSQDTTFLLAQSTKMRHNCSTLAPSSGILGLQ